MAEIRCHLIKYPRNGVQVDRVNKISHHGFRITDGGKRNKLWGGQSQKERRKVLENLKNEMLCVEVRMAACEVSEG